MASEKHSQGIIVDPTADQEIATKKYVDDNAGGTPTKEFWVPCFDSEVSIQLSFFSVTSLSNGNKTNFNFRLPNDFNTATGAAVVIIPDATETIQYDLEMSWAALGELHDDVSTSELDNTLAVTDKALTELDLDSIMTAGGSDPAAGDFIGLEFTSNTTNIKVLGLIFRYT